MSYRLSRLNSFLLWVLLFSLIPPTLSHGEGFRAIENNSSLYGIRVNDMLEDKEGYLWIGTNKGVFRYDGYDLLNVGNTLPISLKASNLQVTAVQEDANHHLWISKSVASEYIILSPDRKSVDTDKYLEGLGMNPISPFLISIDQQGDLWRLTRDSVSHYCFDTGILRTYAANAPLDPNNQRTCVRGGQGLLYIIEGYQLRTFNEHTSTWTEELLPLAIPTMGDMSSSVMLTSAHLDTNGQLWVYSLFSDDILYRQSLGSAWQHITLPDHHSPSATGLHNCIRQVSSDRKQGVWITTNHRGLYHYEPATGTFHHYLHNPSDANSILADNVSKVLVDSHGTLWLGYFKAGMSYLTASLDFIHHHSGPYGDVSALLSEQNGTLWIGTDGRGLWRLEGTLLQRLGTIPDITIADLQRDAEGNIWVATYDRGIYEVEPDGRQIRHFTAAQGHLPHDGASRIAIDANNHIWVCSTLGTLYRFDPQTHSYMSYTYPDGKSICGSAICYDPASRHIFMATYWNLWMHDLSSDTGQIIKGARAGEIPFHSSQINNLWMDSPSRLLWMSHARGITAWDLRSDTLALLSPKDYGHLPEDILSMIEDSSHRLWVAGRTGIAIVLPQQDTEGNRTFRVRRLPIAAPSTVHPYNSHSAASAPWGTMLFGSMDGYTEFLGAALLSQTSEPVKPHVSAIQLGDSIIQLSDLPYQTRPLRLSYEHKPLTVRFFSGNLLGLSEVGYSYRVSGLYDQNDLRQGWVETSLPYLTLHSLPSGHYELELRVMGISGEWSPTCRLPITVDYPWWNTTAMRFVYALLFIAIIVVLVHMARVQQRKRMVKEREELIRQHESRITQLTITPLDQQFLQRAIDLVDEHLPDADFGVEALAAGTNMSRSLLYKKLMAVTGQSPIEFIRRLRMKRAAVMLENTQMQVSEVAYQVGFNTLKTFTENFKQVYGVTPTDYRKKKETSK